MQLCQNKTNNITANFWFVYKTGPSYQKGGSQLFCPELAEQSFVTGRLLSKTWES